MKAWRLTTRMSYRAALPFEGHPLKGVSNLARAQTSSRPEAASRHLPRIQTPRHGVSGVRVYLDPFQTYLFRTPLY